MDDEPLYMLTAILIGGAAVDVIGTLSDLQEQYDAWKSIAYTGSMIELRGVHNSADRAPKQVALAREHVLALVLDRL